VRIAGVIPGEIGSEVNALWVASTVGISVVDTDMVGGRAVPEEQMDIFGLLGIATTPVAVTNARGAVLLVKAAPDSAILESVYRAFAIASGGYCYLAGRPLRQAEAVKLLPPGTVSRALRTGRALRQCGSLDQAVSSLADACDSRLLAAGVIVENRRRDEPGFLAGTLHIRGTDAFEGQGFQLHYKNEMILLSRGDEYLCSVPDLLSVLDVETWASVHVARVAEGARVVVFGTPALGLWRSERGVALCGPKHFGFAHEFRPITGASSR
jgi:DUF917 family protein